MKIEKEYPQKEEFYKTVIRLLSGFIDQERCLTSTEEDVVVFMLMNDGILEGKLRKKICRELAFSTQSLSAHLKRIKLKGWVDTDGLLNKNLQIIKNKVSNGQIDISITVKYG